MELFQKPIKHSMNHFCRALKPSSISKYFEASLCMMLTAVAAVHLLSKFKGQIRVAFLWMLQVAKMARCGCHLSWHRFPHVLRTFSSFILWEGGNRIIIAIIDCQQLPLLGCRTDHVTIGIFYILFDRLSSNFNQFQSISINLNQFGSPASVASVMAVFCLNTKKPK